MDVATIDHWASNRTSPLHRASVSGKIIGAALLISAVVLANNPFLLLAIYCVLLAGVKVTRLPALALISIAAYPTVFALLFAVARLDGSWTTPAIIVLKSLTAAQGMVLLITTTPYTDIFAHLSRFLPRLVADGLFITYHSLFLLLEEMNHMLTALRLRGGITRQSPFRSARNISRSLGMLIIRAISLSERLYEVLRVRGYNGRLRVRARGNHLKVQDLHFILPAASLLGLSLLAVLYPAYWVALSGYILIGAAIIPIAAFSLSKNEPRPALIPLVGVEPNLHEHGSDPDRSGRREIARVSCVRHVYPDGTEVALCGLDFVAYEGEGIVILGPNGAGKSTLLFHLLGLLRSDEGMVNVLGYDPAREFAKIQPDIGVVVQNVDEQLLGPTVLDDIAFGARNAGYSDEEVDRRTRKVLARLGIEHLSERIVHYLSGGEKRKVALAGALVTEPKLLILDEPFEGLDPKSRGELVSLLAELRSEMGLTIIFTTHDVDLVPMLADTVYVLAGGGHIIARGTPEEIFRHHEILEVSNIEAPTLTLLFHHLREAGLELGTPTDVDDASRRLIEAIKLQSPSSIRSPAE